jgi:hypothetical protein
MKTVHIEKSWFYSAGRYYDWTKDGYDMKGIGVEVGIVRENPEFRIIVDNEAYIGSSEAIKAFVVRYQSFYDAKGTKVAVFSKSLLKNDSSYKPEIQPEPMQFSPEKPKSEEVKQTSLFSTMKNEKKEL